MSKKLISINESQSPKKEKVEKTEEKPGEKEENKEESK